MELKLHDSKSTQIYIQFFKKRNRRKIDYNVLHLLEVKCYFQKAERLHIHLGCTLFFQECFMSNSSFMILICSGSELLRDHLIIPNFISKVEPFIKGCVLKWV